MKPFVARAVYEIILHILIYFIPRRIERITVFFQHGFYLHHSV